MARSVALYLEYAGVERVQLLSARMLLEENRASLCARASPERLAELRALVVAGLAMRGVPARAQMRLFHIKLGGLSGNPVWPLFIEVMMNIAVDFFRRQQSGPSEADIRRQFNELLTSWKHLSVAKSRLAFAVCAPSWKR